MGGARERVWELNQKSFEDGCGHPFLHKTSSYINLNTKWEITLEMSEGTR